MRHTDLRTPDEIICDMLADEKGFDEIADRLGLSWGQVRRRYIAFCSKIGVPPDEDLP